MTVGRPALLFCLLVAVVIYFQSNFIVSSMSSGALLAMLFVAASGFLGRYLHTKTHRGPNGPRMTRQDIEREAAAIRDRHASIALVPDLQERLVAIEGRALGPPDALLESIVRPLSVALRTRWARFRLRKIANRELRKTESSARITVEQREELKRSIHRDIVARLLNVRRVAQFDLHERLFSVWRTLHYPLFFVLLPAAALHVFTL